MLDALLKRPHRKTLLPYGKQWIEMEDIAAVVEVLKSDYVTQGPQIERFERVLARKVGASFGVAFCNGTAALHAACFAAGIGEGDEVITSPLTFLASSNCVLYMGGRPVFADVDPNTYNIDPLEIEQKISSRTKAIIPVDFTGQPAKMDRIKKIAKKHNLVIIEDAAHALGALYKGRPVGSLADMTMFSFHPVKHITTGEGGMIVTDNEAFYRRLLLFRNHGMTRDPQQLMKTDGPWYYEMQALGFNYRMTDLQAALGLVQLERLSDFVERRREIARRYNEFFSQLPGLIVPWQHTDTSSSWHLYVLRWAEDYFSADRKQIFEALRDEQIGVNVHYIPVYKQPYYQQIGYNQVTCRHAEAYYANAISIPIFPKMSDSDVEDVLAAIYRIYYRFSIK
ncbi:UDP-4-amino-4,6-dideoxy-N-acetyl-beta-L-altrosamine transaminase [Paenibacillus sp. IB182496]|uniref:UDP-4-amino-4, 6-dideoxy-N-acetyl-beta-L-altrosamine transaminase n=1 Tax=Paenibacillus sabuli TaxID=2772509 RepID=A0A927BUN4_9BACL|nr:UDP-4-amino-4,6-dideoxy-N-acetyl-beta-L-altrosamine transaminase [Paenibacillus sabuli]MBD2845814.1 UDP-4-amino-4,6-dideoxy-N-acetyl-beta-L-altrosamine transaminase [Paenibacillus sabuli]